MLLLIVSFFIFLAYMFFKKYHFYGANILAVCLFYTFSFGFLPIHTKNRIEKWRHYTRKAWHAFLLSLSDLLSLAAIFGGILFKVLHWPIADSMILFGMIFLGITLIGWNRLFSREIVLRKEAEDKVKEAFAELEEKNKEILDSINYAKRLQDAILPSEKLWLSYLPNSFVFYKPKDIVAGDFYWIEKVSQKSLVDSQQPEDIILFAAADCTGHGVPGALVSVVCSNALNRTVKEFNITEPGKILDKVRELVIETFEKSENEVKDGMDISLCALNIKTLQLKWAGANNPLWYLQSPLEEVGEQRPGDSVMSEIKADKQPIGKYADEKPFTTHTIQLKKGDIIYVFTDGYADQFGGPKGKKFKYKQLLELLVSSKNKQLSDQKNILGSTFKNWRAALDQVDDVCIIGVRL
ncbi:MAG: SpoIIE family protein phosphatase [Bacteroidetes bacterium]|nr:SpoIIE family protein phosphatase [Bacteroidota bacterium]